MTDVPSSSSATFSLSVPSPSAFSLPISSPRSQWQRRGAQGPSSQDQRGHGRGSGSQSKSVGVSRGPCPRFPNQGASCQPLPQPLCTLSPSRTSSRGSWTRILFLILPGLELRVRMRILGAEGGGPKRPCGLQSSLRGSSWASPLLRPMASCKATLWLQFSTPALSCPGIGPGAEMMD